MFPLHRSTAHASQFVRGQVEVPNLLFRATRSSASDMFVVRQPLAEVDRCS